MLLVNFKMYLNVVFLSLLSSCLAGLFGKHLGSKGSSKIAISLIAFSFFLSMVLFYEVALAGCTVFVKLDEWISSEILSVDWGFLFDSLAVSMCVVVTFISLLVHFYSTEYMSHDPHLPRFISYLSLFTFFMLILVTADNFIQMFVGWEGVGLCSYLLINFWFTRVQANKAAIKAMIMNRIGDFSLLIGILLIFVNYKSVDYSTVACLTPLLKTSVVSFMSFDVHLLTAVGAFFFLGAVGKSAQIGLHTWLPDAMEGPTPVSALIHAATMVTAGVFLITRSSFIYEYLHNLPPIISAMGVLTSFLASTAGLLQNDLKRVIAYSTCSQLGYMVFACGLSNYSTGFFHLTNHAFFKALLFLSAGSVIHAINDEQDVRKMGGLRNLLPMTYSMILVGSLALTGFPFLAGFYSKDLILESSFGNYSALGLVSYAIGSGGAFLTAFYSARLIYLAFLAKPAGQRKIISYACDSGAQISITLLCLALPSLFVGYYTKDMLVGAGSAFFGPAIFTGFGNSNTFDAEFLPNFYKIIPVSFSLLGWLSALFLYYNRTHMLFQLKRSRVGAKVYTFLNRKWFFDKIYNEAFGQFFFKWGYSVSYKFIDRGIFEILGPTGLSSAASSISQAISSFQSGLIYHVNLSILAGVTCVLSAKVVFNKFGFADQFGWESSFLFLVLLLAFFRSDRTFQGECSSAVER